mgnify:CR=1 FL=1|jgi:hypothetical protein
MNNTTTKDYWTEGYEAPCKANGFQSNKPSAFAIELHFSSECVLRTWFLNTTSDLLTRKYDTDRLKKQLEAVKAEYAYRNLELPNN